MDIKRIEQKTMDDTRLSVAKLCVFMRKCENCTKDKPLARVPEDVPIDIVMGVALCGFCQLELDEADYERS